MPRPGKLADADLFRAYWDDGLLDILFGLGLLVIGVGWMVDISWLGVIQVPVWFVLWAPLRRRFVEPRAGFVEFSLARRRRTSRGLWGTLALGVAVLAVTVILLFAFRTAQGAGPVLQRLVVGLPAALVAIAAFLAGLLTGARRFHAYGAALLAGAAVAVMIGRGPFTPLVVVGLLAVVSGAVLLARFVRASSEYEERR